MIELRNVSVQSGVFALVNVSFTVPAGEFGVVVGAAGAGKTTMLEAIAGVRALSAGFIGLGTRDVTRLLPEQRNVGFVYQRGALFPHKTVLENIGYAAAHSRAIVTAVVERLGITSLIGTPVVSLSGGERQLVALARALVRVQTCMQQDQPAVLLLDEPFSALDPRRRVATRNAVRDFHREWKLTTLQVTHDGADARQADVAVLLDGGMVVQSGPPNAMLASPVREDVALFLS